MASIPLNYRYIENISTGKIVSEYRNYYVTEGYLDRIWASAFGGGYVTCDEAFSDIDRFSRKKITLSSALKPRIENKER